ncbi:MAG: asparagine synthase-related protein, partial [Planctomycetota bacterium]|nr:asparagine synthase-related protein [Planctomycetota bacterium]
FLGWRGAREVMLSSDLKRVLETDSNAFSGLREFWGRFPRFDRLNRVLYTDVKTNLADYLITIEERASMSYGLETRNPMLDERVVRFLLSLPPSFKVREGKNKWIFHRLCDRYLPRQVFDRPKRGFTPPLTQWLAHRAEAIAETFREHQGELSHVFSKDWLTMLTGGRYQSLPPMALYYSLVMTMWIRNYGKYIGDWPKPGSDSTGASSLWHTTFRTQEPETVSQGRWFTQALRNFPPGATLRLLGDQDEFHAFLAHNAGYMIAQDEMEPFDGLVCIGHEAVEEFKHNASRIDTKVLCFVPFESSNQDQATTLIDSLSETMDIKGKQSIQLGPTLGLFVVVVRPSRPQFAASA